MISYGLKVFSSSCVSSIAYKYHISYNVDLKFGSMLSKAMLGPWRSNGEHLILIPGRRGTVVLGMAGQD